MVKANGVTLASDFLPPPFALGIDIMDPPNAAARNPFPNASRHYYLHHPHRVRQEMKQVLTEAAPVPFLDSKSAEFLEEARRWFKGANLNERRWIVDGNSILLLGWRGDSTHDALALLLTARGMHTSNEGAAIRTFSTDQQRLIALLCEIASGSTPTIEDLHIKPEGVIREKWDWTLPAELHLRSYVTAQLDIVGAQQLALALSQVSDAAAQQDFLSS